MVKRLYKKWKSGRGRREEYVKGRKSLREFLKFKIRGKEEKEERRIKKEEEKGGKRIKKVEEENMEIYK